MTAAREGAGRLLRSEPFRLFFPLAFVLGAAGIAHWVLFTAGLTAHYLGHFHAVTQTQAFLVAFAAGFLGTAIPRRTRTESATWVELGALLLLLPSVALATLFDHEILAQAAYALALLTLTQFALRRFCRRTPEADHAARSPAAVSAVSAPRRPPASFAMVPVGLAAGLVGAAFTAGATGAAGAAPGWMNALGQRLTFEGVFTCLTLGVGAFFLPLAGRGEGAPDVGPGRRWHAAVYVAAAGAVIAGLVLEVGGWPRRGAALRGAVALAVIVASGAWRPPSRSGANRAILWMAVWALPVGLIGAAAFPGARVEALHVMFVGGFGVISFAVSTHVTLGHTGQEARQSTRPWPVVAFGLLFAAALAFRISAIGDPPNYFLWLGTAATSWLLGATAWAAFALPSMLRMPATVETSGPAAP